MSHDRLVSDIHPDLARIARFLPRNMAGPIVSPLMRGLRHLARMSAPAGVTVTAVSSPVPMRVYRPDGLATPCAALVWMHGGGMVAGNARQDEASMGAAAKDLGILIASVDYRLAPKHPYPAALDDCYAALSWLHQQPEVDPTRVAVGGASAGGGLAASLAQVAHDRGELAIAFQLLVYPMLDDRSATRPGVDCTNHRLWSQKSNAYGWRCYLGTSPAAAPAVPARRADLSGLPPAWIGVGLHDLFHDEDIEYADRLRAAGVPCQVEVVDGAFHGFDAVAATTPIAKAFTEGWRSALRDGLAAATT